MLTYGVIFYVVEGPTARSLEPNPFGQGQADEAGALLLETHL